IFGAGTLNSAMVNFLDVPTFSTTEVEEKRVAGFVRGTVFELPAGPLSTVFGFEWRESAADFRVDNEQRTGNIFGFNAIQNQKGSVDVKELYTEVAVPLLADLPFVHYLGLEGGYRYSDYSTIGGTDTYKVGLEYEPTDWLKIRTVFNSAVRAPSVFELFQNGDQGFENYVDPCDSGQTPTAQQLAICQAQAPNADFNGFTQLNTQTEAFAFGNPNLAPESAETFTVGVVFQPATFPIGQFRASLDYYDIEITDVISSFGSQYWINQCYDAPSNADACARITRTADGQVDFVNTSVDNAGYQKTKGYDLQIDWSIPLEDYTPLPGRLRINELFTYVDSLEIDGDEYAGTGFAGIGGVVFDIKSVLSVAYDISDWTFFTRWTYIGETDDIGFGPNFIDGSPEYLDASSYVDMTARWDVTDMLQVTANIGNVFDELPPVTASGS
ncbi:MAG: TonB-dependent receptor, partial [Rhizobiaceae bacterium]